MTLDAQDCMSLEVFTTVISPSSSVMMKRFQNSGKRYIRRTYPESGMYLGNKRPTMYRTY